MMECKFVVIIGVDGGMGMEIICVVVCVGYDVIMVCYLLLKVEIKCWELVKEMGNEKIEVW